MAKSKTSKSKSEHSHSAQKRTKKIPSKTNSLQARLRTMYTSQRIKAFITDMFMVNMPLLYLTTYIFLDGKESFIQNQNAILVCSLIYGVVLSLFFAFSSQTPGYRYAGLRLKRFSNKGEDKIKISFLRAFIRYILWIVSISLLFGILIGLFRKDGRCLHDILCDTKIVEE